MEYERFAALTLPHTRAMTHVAAALVGLADAEDAAQEALLRAWNGWASLRDAGAARAWLLRITVNVCRNWQAGHFGSQRSRTLPFPEWGDNAPPSALIGAGPGTSEHTGALDLRAAVAALPSDLRTIVALRFYAGMDATEIGQALDLPPPTVRGRLRRALERLRDNLGADQSEQTDQTHQHTGSAPHFTTFISPMRTGTGRG